MPISRGKYLSTIKGDRRDIPRETGGFYCCGKGNERLPARRRRILLLPQRRRNGGRFGIAGEYGYEGVLGELAQLTPFINTAPRIGSIEKYDASVIDNLIQEPVLGYPKPVVVLLAVFIRLHVEGSARHGMRIGFDFLHSRIKWLDDFRVLLQEFQNFLVELDFKGHGAEKLSLVRKQGFSCFFPGNDVSARIEIGPACSVFAFVVERRFGRGNGKRDADFTGGVFFRKGSQHFAHGHAVGVSTFFQLLLYLRRQGNENFFILPNCCGRHMLIYEIYVS